MELALVGAVLIAAGVAAILIWRMRAAHELDSTRLRIQYAVARTLYESRSLEEAAPGLMESIGRPFGWDIGGLWIVAPPRVLRCVESWHTAGVDPAGFDKLSRQYVLRPGFGLPGRVWESGQPGWMADVVEDRDFPRAELAAEVGLHGAVGFPIRTAEEVLGVIEFFTREFREPDADMLELMAAVGSQVGEFIERQRAAEGLQASEELKSAMLEAALDCVITIDHEGHVLEFNPAAESTFGYAQEEATGRELAELIVPPSLREQHRAALRRIVETGEARILGERLELTGMRAGGEEFPVEVALTRIGGQDPPLFTGYLRDITERTRAEEERNRLLELERIARVDATQARDQLAAILSGVADGVVAESPEGDLIFANEAAAVMYDFDDPDDLIHASREERVARVEIADEPDGTLRVRKRATGEVRWVLMKSTPIRDDSRVTMSINVLEDVTEHKRRERVQRLLAETGRVLGSLLDPEEMLERVAKVLVPELADWCVIYLASERGGPIAAVTMVFDEPDKEETVRRELSRYPVDPEHPAGLAESIRTGESQLVADVDEAAMRAVAQDEAHLELIRAERMRSRMLVPLSSRDRTFGAMSLATSGSGRIFDLDDLRLAEEIGRRSGAAVENARLYSERSQIATTLQESLLPPELPVIPGLETAARFRPTGQVGVVGGDFYDLFQAGRRRWAVVVGDVCGKGPDAAAVTALARYTLRAAAMSEDSPSGSLAMLNEALLRQRSDLRFCTVGYAHLEPRRGGVRVTLASGGHPLPLLLRRDGSVDWFGAHGTLLGVVSDPDLVDSQTELQRGDSLVFYTDGVSEAHGEGGSLDDAALAAIVRDCAGLPPDEIAARIEAAALEVQAGNPRDDIAVVVVHAGDGPTRTG